MRNQVRRSALTRSVLPSVFASSALLSVAIVASRGGFQDRGCVEDQPERLGSTGALWLVEDETAAVLWLRLCRVVCSAVRSHEPRAASAAFRRNFSLAAAAQLGVGLQIVMASRAWSR